MAEAFNKICEDCGTAYRGRKNSRYCQNCKRKRTLQGARKGGLTTQAARAEGKYEPTGQIPRTSGIKVGDRVSVRPATFGDGHMYGKVVWIHPDRRYAVVEFTFEPKQPRWGKLRPVAKIRECFHLAHKPDPEVEEELRLERLAKPPTRPSKW